MRRAKWATSTVLTALVLAVVAVTALGGSSPAVAASSSGTPWATVTTDGLTTCGVKVDRSGWCWGVGAQGQLGNGTQTAAQTTPVRVPGAWEEITPVQGTLWGTNGTVCGIRTDRTGWCWGDNTYGQVGAAGAPGLVLVPTRLPGRWSSIVIAPSFQTVCGVQVDSTGWCWGDNRFGQVGDGRVQTSEPTPVQLPGSWRSLSPDDTTCGVRTNATGWCWGYNIFGSVGDGTTDQRESPVRIPGTWTHIAVNSSVSCGIRTDGTARCWGSNAYGDLGVGGTADRHSPTPVAGGGTWRSIANSAWTTCGIKGDNTGWCWGLGEYGQLGDGGTAQSSRPVQVPGTWTTLRPGFTVCGTTTNARGWCWGMNDSGSVGAGSTTDQLSPYRLPLHWQALDATFSTSGGVTCGVAQRGQALCWGGNAYGQLGDGTETDRTVPTRVHG